MNIDMIRSYIYKRKGKLLNFRYNNGRGQFDNFSGIITNVYKGIFVVESITDNRVKSFTYSDVLIKNLLILE